MLVNKHVCCHFGGHVFTILLPVDVLMRHVWIEFTQNFFGEFNQVFFGTTASYFRFDNVFRIAFLIMIDQ